MSRSSPHETVAQELLDCVKRGESAVLEAYPGFGKTMIASRILASLEKCTVVVRTHEEIKEVFRFLNGAKACYAYGRPKLCYRQPTGFSYAVCRLMAMAGECNTEVDSSDVAWLAATLRTPDEIRARASSRNRCLYPALRLLASKAKKLVATYEYVVRSPEVIEGRPVVFDEAQTLLEYAEDSVLVLNDATVSMLAKALKKSEDTARVAYALKACIKRGAGISELVSVLETVLSSVTTETEEVALLESAVRAYRKGWCHRGDGGYYFLLDALPRIARVEPKVLLGAYLPPPFIHSGKNVIRVPGEPKVETIIDDSLTSKYTERSDAVYAEYARKLEEYARHDAGNLAVFPSKQFMSEVLARASPQLGNRLLTRPVDGAVPAGYVLVDVAGGRFTEGVNIAGVGNVIVCGMPYPEPTPVLDLLSKVYGYDSVYTYIAMLRAVQAVGRIRGSGTAVLVDKRFKEHVDKIPRWIKLS